MPHIFKTIPFCCDSLIIIIYFQLVSLILAAIYYGQISNEDGVMNINGALFIFLTNMTFQNVFAVITVS